MDLEKSLTLVLSHHPSFKKQTYSRWDVHGTQINQWILYRPVMTMYTLRLLYSVAVIALWFTSRMLSVKSVTKRSLLDLLFYQGRELFLRCFIPPYWQGPALRWILKLKTNCKSQSIIFLFHCRYITTTVGLYLYCYSSKYFAVDLHLTSLC